MNQFKWRLCKKGLLYSVVILLTLGMYVTDQYSGRSWVNIVFSPIRIGSGTLYWGGILILGAVYWMMVDIYKVTKTKWLKDGWRRFLAMFMVVIVAQNITAHLMTWQLQFREGIYTITLDREHISVETEISDNEDKVEFSGGLNLYNGANTDKKIGIKIKIPKDVPIILKEEIASGYLDLGYYTVGAKTNRHIHFEQTFDLSYIEGNHSYSSSRRSYGEVIIYDDTEQVVFESEYENE